MAASLWHMIICHYQPAARSISVTYDNRHTMSYACRLCRNIGRRVAERHLFIVILYSLYSCHQLLYVRTAAAGGGDCGLTSKYSVKVSPTAGTVSLRRLSHYQQLAGLAASRLKMEFDECLVAEIHVASQLR